MNTRGIIDRARKLAGDFKQKGHDRVRLPAFDYQDWLAVYSLPHNGESQLQFRGQVRHTWYLIHFLQEMGIKVEPVPVRSTEFLNWAGKNGASLKNGHDRGHAVGDYVNDPKNRPAPCNHADASELLKLGGEALFATITVFGEQPQEPEVMSVVLHLSDGSVVNSMQILADDHTPQEAWDMATGFLDKHQPQKVFHDRTVRTPSFCEDCGSLLVNVASPEDMAGAGQ
jgi:hypothetical protein